ncbi:MAG: MFS transporter [Solobacterium sp.]|nr:MFS transporter [Solobacterium sp.]
MNEEKITKRNLWCFPVGTIGRDMVYVLIANFLLTYTMFTRELTHAQLGAITAIMVAARIFDALNDPIMGNIIERTRTKWGKFKPWLTAGALTTTFVIVFLFNTSLTGWPFIIAFGISYFAYSITYTMNDISYWGMIPALSRDSTARDMFTSRATLCAGIGNALASVAIPLLTTGAMALGGNAKSGYGIVSVIVCAAALFTQIFTIFGVRENRDDMNTEPVPLSLKKILSTFTGNDQLRWIGLCFLIHETGSCIIAGGLGSTYIYFTYGYRGGLYSTFTLVGMSATAFLMIFYPTISKKLGRKKLMDILAVVAMTGYVMMLGSLLLEGSMTGFWVLTIGFMIASFGQYGYYLIMMIAILNTVEYNEYLNGTRDEAIIGSLRPFLTKMSSAVVVMITTITYMIFGVTHYTNQISSLESSATSGAISEAEKLTAIDQVLSTVKASQTSGLLWVMVLLSAVLMLMSYFIYSRKYKLDEAEYERICGELEARRTAG